MIYMNLEIYKNEFIGMIFLLLAWSVYVLICENLTNELLKEIIYCIVIFVVILILAVDCLMS